MRVSRVVYTLGAMPGVMFEGGKIKRCDAQGAGAAAKRELRWTELVAQLAATRDLRGEQGRKNGEGGASGRFMSLNTGFAEASRRDEDHKQNPTMSPGLSSAQSSAHGYSARHGQPAYQEPVDDAASRRLTPRTVAHRKAGDRAKDRESS